MNKTIAKKLSNVTGPEYLVLNKLNMGSYGQMQYILDELYFGGDKDAMVIIHKVDDTIVGWGIIFTRYETGLKSFQVYVHNDWRRKGIGSKILQRARKMYDEFDVFPWDEQSHAFFGKFGAEEKATGAFYDTYKMDGLRLGVDKRQPVR